MHIGGPLQNCRIGSTGHNMCHLMILQIAHLVVRFEENPILQQPLGCAQISAIF
jgi:hypothetical protein